MSRITSNMILLTLLKLCLLVNALPSMQNVQVMNDDDISATRDESDSSSGNFAVPDARNRKINERKLMGRENDAPSKCGYEVMCAGPRMEENPHLSL